MRKLVSKIVVIILLLSSFSEVIVPVFASGERVCQVMESDESEEKKEEKKENEETKDKISLAGSFAETKKDFDNFMLLDDFVTTSAYKSLPEIPPDQA